MAKKKNQKEEKFTAAAKEKCGYISTAMAKIRNDKMKSSKDHEFTQEFMADKIGCSRSEISGYERGIKKVPIYVVIMYAEILEVDIYSFIETRDEEMENRRTHYTNTAIYGTEEEKIIAKIERNLPGLSKEYLTNIYNNIMLQKRQ